MSLDSSSHRTAAHKATTGSNTDPTFPPRHSLNSSRTMRQGQSPLAPTNHQYSINSSSSISRNNGSSATEDIDRVRLYKAQAYEAKITIASQTQRIEALQAELDDVRRFIDAERMQQAGVSGGTINGLSVVGTTNGIIATDNKDSGDSRQDAELIEALAQELESMERDLAAANGRVEKLEQDLMLERQKIAQGRGNSSLDSNSAAVSAAIKESYEKKQIELQNLIDRQKKELLRSKEDAAEGVAIMRDLEKALRAARSERDGARSERDQALADMVTKKVECDALQESLTISGANLERAQNLEKSNKELQDLVTLLQSRYTNLEQSNAELQNVLSVVQSRSEKKMQQMKQTLKETEDREAMSSSMYQNLIQTYDEQQSQLQEMETVLSDLTEKFQEQKNELTVKDETLEKMEQIHATQIDNLEKQHKELIEKKLCEKDKEHDHALRTHKIKHDTELQFKDNFLKSRENYWEGKIKDSIDTAINAIESKHSSEIESMKGKIHELEKLNITTKTIMNEKDTSLITLKNENEKLQAENSELLRRIERCEVIHDGRIFQLKTKNLELTELKASLDSSSDVASIREDLETKLSQKDNEIKHLQFQLASALKTSPNKGLTDADLAALNKSLKKDLTSAVESSIARGREIQALEKELEACHAKLSKANQKIKRFEKNGTSPKLLATNVTAPLEEEKQRLEFDVSNLRSEAVQTQKTISDLREEVSLLSMKVSYTESLEVDLTKARLALADSQSRVFNLQEALQETETALRTVSSACLKSSPTNASSRSNETRENSEMRRQMENEALKQYVGHRMEAGPLW